MHWASIVLGATAVVTLLGAGWAYTWRRVRPRQRAFASFLEQWHGEPEKRGAAGMLIEEARPGVMERLGAVEGQVTGFGDRFTAVEHNVDKLASDVAIMRGQVAEVREQMRANGGTSIYDKVTSTAEKVTQIVEGQK